MIQGASRPLDFELDFHNRPHPFKIFEELEVPKLIQTESSRYSECLIQENNNSSLAYYLFKNNDLSRSSRNSAKGWYLKFILKYGGFDSEKSQGTFHSKAKHMS